jgi:predicted alpha/beta superfamily hydrolase
MATTAQVSVRPILLLAVFASALAGCTDPRGAPAEGVLIPLRARATSVWTLASKEGRDYRIQVSLPRGSAPPGGFPVIYVLDGEAWFGAAVEIARIREHSKLSPAVIVGVGYPSRKFFDAERRSFDFTPPGSFDADMESDEIELGGAGQFLTFLNETLKPRVRAKYPVSSEHETLFGHSLGGLFVLYALFEAPESFETFLAASPSMFFSDSIVLKGEPTFTTNPAREAARVLVTAGEFEAPKVSPELVEDYRRYFTAHPEVIDGETVSEALAAMFAPRENVRGRHAASEACALVERLSQSGVVARFALFAGEEHTSAAVSALNRGIPFALRPEPEAVTEVSGDAHGCEAARELISRPS